MQDYYAYVNNKGELFGYGKYASVYLRIPKNTIPGYRRALFTANSTDEPKIWVIIDNRTGRASEHFISRGSFDKAAFKSAHDAMAAYQKYVAVYDDCMANGGNPTGGILRGEVVEYGLEQYLDDWADDGVPINDAGLCLMMLGDGYGFGDLSNALEDPNVPNGVKNAIRYRDKLIRWLVNTEGKFTLLKTLSLADQTKWFNVAKNAFNKIPNEVWLKYCPWFFHNDRTSISDEFDARYGLKNAKVKAARLQRPAAITKLTQLGFNYVSSSKTEAIIVANDAVTKARRKRIDIV